MINIPGEESICADVYVDVVITSAHRLPHVAPTHRCRNLHGHDFRIRIVGEGIVFSPSECENENELGMVADYDRILELWKPLYEQLDHVVLNEVEGLENPTCENLAIWILRRTPKWIARVEVATTVAGGQGGCIVHREDLPGIP